jgi:hypothetical protein
MGFPASGRSPNKDFESYKAQPTRNQLSAQSASGDLCLASGVAASKRVDGSALLLQLARGRIPGERASAPVKYRVGNLAGGHS